MALKEAIKEALFIKAICQQVPYLKGRYSPRILTDSQSAIELAKNPIHHNRTKHVDIQYHFVRENHLSGAITLIYIPTAEELADPLTKAVDNVKWAQFIENIGLRDLTNQPY